MPTALITGASRGLGAELARQYEADGWRVIAATRGELDVTDRPQIRKFAASLAATPIDLLFCNAGIAGKRGMGLGSFDYDSWDEVLRVNLLGAAAVAEAFVENVAASERKVIEGLKPHDSGRFLNHDGMQIPW